MKFIAIDHYHGSGTRVIVADTVEDAAERAAGSEVKRPLHIEKKDDSTFHVMDDISFEGWGPECKYEGTEQSHRATQVDHFWLVCLDGDPALQIVE